MNAKRTCETCVFFTQRPEEAGTGGWCRREHPRIRMFGSDETNPGTVYGQWPLIHELFWCGEHRTEAEFEAERAHASGILATLVDRNTRLLGEHNKLAAEVRAHGQEIAERIAKLTEHRRKLAVTLADALLLVDGERKASILGYPEGVGMSQNVAAAFLDRCETTDTIADDVDLLLSYLDTGKLPEEAEG